MRLSLGEDNRNCRAGKCLYERYSDKMLRRIVESRQRHLAALHTRRMQRDQELDQLRVAQNASY